jgi:hypothetical protein
MQYVQYYTEMDIRILEMKHYLAPVNFYFSFLLSRQLRAA